MPRPKLSPAKLRQRTEEALNVLRAPFLIQEVSPESLKKWVYRVGFQCRSGKLGKYDKRAVAPLFGKDGLGYLKWRARLHKIEITIKSRGGLLGRNDKQWFKLQMRLYRSVNLPENRAIEIARLSNMWPFLNDIDALSDWRRSLAACKRFVAEHKRLPLPTERTHASLNRVSMIVKSASGEAFVRLWLESNEILRYFEPILVSSNQWVTSKSF